MVSSTPQSLGSSASIYEASDMTVDTRDVSGLDSGCIGRSGDSGWISRRGGPESKEAGWDRAASLEGSEFSFAG